MLIGSANDTHPLRLGGDPIFENEFEYPEEHSVYSVSQQPPPPSVFNGPRYKLCVVK